MKHFFKIAVVLTIILDSNNASGQSHGWTVTPSDYSNSAEVVAVVFNGTNEVTTGTLGAFVGGTCRGYADGMVFGPTGKTVFIVICYSNVASGETLTFRYYDQVNNKFYDIKETVAFVADTQTGNAMFPLSFHTLPLVYTVTGGGSYCEGGTGLPVGLDNSETGVTYTLFKNSIAQTPTVDGTGSAISFGDQLAGTYTISGTNSGGTTAMTGSAVITTNPLPSQPATFTTSTAIVCPGTSNVVYTVPNDPTVTYTWSYSGTGATITGTTNSVSVSYSTISHVG